MNELQSQLTLALIVPYVLQWLKGQKWAAFITYHSGKLNALVAATVAFLGGLGIGFKFDDSAHQLIVSGLSWPGIWSGLQHFITQFMMQHAAYKTLIAPPLPGIVQAVQRDTPAPAVVAVPAPPKA